MTLCGTAVQLYLHQFCNDWLCSFYKIIKVPVYFHLHISQSVDRSVSRSVGLSDRILR